MWRPEGWKNPYKITIYREKAEPPRDQTTIKTGGYTKERKPDPVYEAGADAMKACLTPYLLGSIIPLSILEALKGEYDESQKGLASERRDQAENS